MSGLLSGSGSSMNPVITGQNVQCLTEDKQYRKAYYRRGNLSSLRTVIPDDIEEMLRRNGRNFSYKMNLTVNTLQWQVTTSMSALDGWKVCLHS